MRGPGVQKVTSDDPDLRWYRRGDQHLRLADAVDGSAGAAMTVGFARYAAGESNDWVMSYDEALVVTRGSFAVDSGGDADRRRAPARSSTSRPARPWSTGRSRTARSSTSRTRTGTTPPSGRPTRPASRSSSRRSTDERDHLRRLDPRRHDAGSRRMTGHAWAVLLVLCGTVFLEGLDVSMMGVALPSMRADLEPVHLVAAVGRQRLRARVRRLRAARRAGGRPVRAAAHVPAVAGRVHRLLGPRRPGHRRLDADRRPLRHRRGRRVPHARQPVDHHHVVRPGRDQEPGTARLRRHRRRRVHARHGGRRAADDGRMAVGVLRPGAVRLAAARAGPPVPDRGRSRARCRVGAASTPPGPSR